MCTRTVTTLAHFHSITLVLLITAAPAISQPKAEIAKESDPELAIHRGLAWLAQQQQRDGSWTFDGNSRDKCAATGMALLPFLAAGEGPAKAVKYQEVVKRGADWLVNSVQKDGKLATSMYAHAIGTIALCNAYHLSQDATLREKAAQAVDYIVKAQGTNGSWGYSAGLEGDTSIVCWQVQALAAAERAGIAFESAKVFKKANSFLEGVSTDGGSKYGYREKGASQTLTPDGLMSRYLMGTLLPTDQAFGAVWNSSSSFRPRRATSTCITTTALHESCSSAGEMIGASSGTRRCAICCSVCRKSVMARIKAVGRRIKASLDRRAVVSVRPRSRC